MLGIQYAQLNLQNLPPLIMTAQGPLPQSPTSLRQQLTNLVSASTPNYTNLLPGSLIEDIASTDVGAMTVIDQARVATINALTPYGCNAFVLNALGQALGIQLGQGSNTTVPVQFSGTVGYPLPQGFLVGDGVYQYTLNEGTVIGSGGTSPTVTATATIGGSWAVPVSTVTEVLTSVPSGFTVAVTNPEAGTPATGIQTVQDYRAQVLQANLAASQGMTRFLKTLLLNVAGVQPRLISARSQTGGGWEIIVGGGDLLQVANAVFMSLFDVSTLVGSTLAVTAFTQANPGVVTTSLNHGYTTGQLVTISGSTVTAYNATYTATVLSQTTFSVGVNTSGYAAYVSGGVATPNNRNATATIQDYPDSYNIPIVLPPQQNTVVAITWNTNLANYTSQAAVVQLGTPAVVAYVNSVAVGQPLNLNVLNAAFQAAIASVLPPANLTRFNVAISLNGTPTSPVSGTEEIPGDPESYFFTATNGSQVTITQG